MYFYTSKTLTMTVDLTEFTYNTATVSGGGIHSDSLGLMSFTFTFSTVR